MNPPGMFRDGKRLRAYALKDAPAFSGKLLPEFDRRRNIKDMFTRKPSLVSAQNSMPTPSTPPATPSVAEDEGNKDEIVSDRNNLNSPAQLPGSQKVAPPADAVPKAEPSPERKRAATGAPTSKPAKRSKAGGPSVLSTTPNKGQQSLKGFFKARVVEPTAVDNLNTTDSKDDTKAPSEPATTQETTSTEATPQEQLAIPSAAAPSLQAPTSPPGVQPVSTGSLADSFSKTSDGPDIVDPIVSKESWGKLFAKPAAPRCEGHDEPCISLLTKKSGFNCGRSFWICPRYVLQPAVP